MSGLAMGENYNHLTLEERCRWRGLMEMGLGVGEIARRLGRNRATIHRDLRHDPSHKQPFPLPHHKLYFTERMRCRTRIRDRFRAACLLS